MGVKLGCAKLQSSTPREACSNWGLNGGCRKNVRFSTENWPYIENVDGYGLGYY